MMAPPLRNLRIETNLRPLREEISLRKPDMGPLVEKKTSERTGKLPAVLDYIRRHAAMSPKGSCVAGGDGGGVPVKLPSVKDEEERREHDGEERINREREDEKGFERRALARRHERDAAVLRRWSRRAARDSELAAPPIDGVECTEAPTHRMGAFEFTKQVYSRSSPNRYIYRTRTVDLGRLV